MQLKSIYKTALLFYVLDPDLLGNRTRRPGSVVLLSNPRELGLIMFKSLVSLELAPESSKLSQTSPWCTVLAPRLF